MVFNFMSDGIPVVYYGQEQSFSGSADPVSFPPPISRTAFSSALYIDEPRTIVALWVQEYNNLPAHHDAQQGMIRIQVHLMLSLHTEFPAASQLLGQEFSRLAHVPFRGDLYLPCWNFYHERKRRLCHDYYRFSCKLLVRPD